MTDRIYCSGPLFCPEERAGMARIASVLEAAGYATFLPQRDGLERVALPLLDGLLGRTLGAGRAGGRMSQAIFDLDVFQVVERCQGLVINLNGRVPDEGAVAEAALAFAVGRPVVIAKDDRRAPFAGLDNSMVLGLSSLPRTIERVGDLPDAVAAALAAASPAPGPLAPRLAESVERGRRIWRLLRALPRDRPDDASGPAPEEPPSG